MDRPSPVPCILLTVEVRSRSKDKHTLRELLAHPDSRIAHADFIAAGAFLLGDLLQLQGYPAAFLRKLPRPLRSEVKKPSGSEVIFS